MDMKVCTLMVQLTVLYLVIPYATGWWFFNEDFCGFFWDIACPLGIAAGAGAGAIGGAVLAKQGCSFVKKSTCKRTIETISDMESDMEGKVEYAFPDEFDSYDMNRDGQIEYEEFAFTLMRIFPMQQPEEFRGPFQDADLNGNGRIERDEWEKAPFIFRRHVEDDNEGFCTTKRRLCAGLNECNLQRDSTNWMTSTSCFNIASANRSCAQTGLQ